MNKQDAIAVGRAIVKVKDAQVAACEDKTTQVQVALACSKALFAIWTEVLPRKVKDEIRNADTTMQIGYASYLRACGWWEQ